MASVKVDPDRVHEFADAESFYTWLAKHHDVDEEVWIKIHKVGSGRRSIRPVQALEARGCVCTRLTVRADAGSARPVARGLPTALAIALSVCACTPPATDAPRPPSPSSATLATLVVRYDCAGFAQPPACARTPSVVSSVVSALRSPSGWADAVATAERLDAASLDDEERAEAQLAMRYVAHLAANDPELRQRAARTTARFLVPVRDAAADPGTAIDAWIGPRAQWIEKQVEPPLLHEHESGYALAFRPVRSGELRALVAQRVVVDAAWGVRVTEVVERIIVRRGTAVDAPACVVVRDLELRRCGGMRALDDARDLVPPSPFVPVAGDHEARCRSCHGPGKRGDLVDLDAASARAALERRRVVFLEHAALEAVALRAWADATEGSRP